MNPAIEAILRLEDTGEVLAAFDACKTRLDELERKRLSFRRGDRVAWDGRRGHKTGTSEHPTCESCGEQHEEGAFVGWCEQHDNCREWAECGSGTVWHSNGEEEA